MHGLLTWCLHGCNMHDFSLRIPGTREHENCIVSLLFQELSLPDVPGVTAKRIYKKV